MRICSICGVVLPTHEDVLWHSIIHKYDQPNNHYQVGGVIT